MPSTPAQLNLRNLRQQVKNAYTVWYCGRFTNQAEMDTAWRRYQSAVVQLEAAERLSASK